MEPSLESVTSGYELFKHTELDQNKPSLRLIQILPDLSKENLVQCKLIHALLPPSYLHAEDREDHSITIQSQEGASIAETDEESNDSAINYLCLSYMWGDPLRQHAITINGKRFQVRRNLWGFLRMAREKLPHVYLWIDALCIDQSNTLERNHQVQQMGSIYSRADMVLLWLGNDVELEHVLHSVSMGKKGRDMQTFIDSLHLLEGISESRSRPGRADITYLTDVSNPNLASSSVGSVLFKEPLTGLEGFDFFADATGKVEKRLEKITENEYWSRAWVIQEVLLAKRTFILAGRVAHSLRSLALRYRDAVPHYRDNPFETIVDILLQKSLTRGNTQAFKTWGVVNLVHWFRNTKCFIQRDRIYSLLALCKEGEKLKVDYNIPEQRLLRQVLSLRESHMCFCSAAAVSHALGPWKFDTEQHSTDETAFIETHVYSCALSSAVCPFCANWVPFSWTRKRGLLFCLGTACPDMQGHLYWEQYGNFESSNRQNESSAPSAGAMYAQFRSNNKSHLLCDEGAGVNIKQSEWNDVYLLRFTFRTFVEMLKEDFATNGLGLNACTNMWPNSSDGRIGEGRLRFCT
ncbi:heterokaryon incompatibility protein-domain-containing protein [Pyrenochaeta sp. MPI-SDFR-AT-0127]|nr:heterokaryon incompatibility protein-domain-containing protein [Pyrenochaeta sp. MPI-SDFR-AT-0127]